MFAVRRLVTTAMAFKSPPELLLRNAIRNKNGSVTSSQMAGQRSYKAAVCTELNKPLVLQDATPEPLQNGAVRVAIHSTGINFADALQVQGKYQVKPPLPFITGSEISGKVLEVGEGVESLSVGDRVAGLVTNGSFAEETTASELSMWKIPDSIDYKPASSLVCTYGTAWMALVHRAKIQQGETVLITAAAGGMGTALVDIAVNVFNCTVIAACGGSEKCDLMKRRGAQHVIDYRREDMKERVLEITNGNGADVICDNIGGQNEFRTLLRCISFEGRVVVIGFAQGTIPQIPANIVMLKSISVLGVFWGSYSMREPLLFRKSVNEVLRFAGEGKINPHICASFPLAQANEALQFIKDRKSTGKVVLSIR